MDKRAKVVERTMKKGWIDRFKTAPKTEGERNKQSQ